MPILFPTVKLFFLVSSSPTVLSRCISDSTDSPWQTKEKLLLLSARRFWYCISPPAPIAPLIPIASSLGKRGGGRWNPPLPPSPPQSSSPPLPPTPSPYQHNGNLSGGEKKPLALLTYERAPPGNIKYRTSICDDNRTGDVPRKSNSGSSSIVVLTWNRRDKFLSRVVEGGFFLPLAQFFPFSGEGQATLSPLSLPPPPSPGSPAAGGR